MVDMQEGGVSVGWGPIDKLVMPYKRFVRGEYHHGQSYKEMEIFIKKFRVK